MTTAAIEQSDHPRWPMKFTDPRDHGLPQETFDRHWVDCDPLGGITRQDLCPIECSSYQGDDCPLKESIAGCEELTTSPSEEVTGDELTLKAVTAERVDVAAQVEDGDGDGCTDPLAPSATASDMVERDSKDGVRPSPAPLEPVEPELPIEAEEPGASATKDSPPAAATATAAEPPGRTPPGHCDSTESDTNPSGEEEPLVAVEDVPDVPVVLDAVEHGSKATDRGVLEVDVPPSASGLIQAADGGGLWTYLSGLVDGDSAPTAGDVTPGCIQTWHLEIEASTRRAVVHACLIGLALIDQKASLRHGQFKPWIAEHCVFAYSTAAVYMRVARWAVEKYSARDFSWADMSIREVDRLLPSPGKKKNNRKKGISEDSTPTSTAETTAPADAGDTPSPTTTSPETGAQTNAETPADIDDGGDTGHATDEDDSTAAAVSEDTGNTTTEGEPGIEEESIESVTVDERAVPASLGIEAAMARLAEEIKTSPDPRVCAKEMFSQIIAAAGLTSLAKRRVLLLRPPLAQGDARRPVPKRAQKASAPVPPTKALPRSSRTLKFKDLQSGRCAGA